MISACVVHGLFAAMLASAFAIEGPAHRYGAVVLEGKASKAGVPAVVFEHWRHRALFTCRLCHVELRFALARGATGISASTNRSGRHCGACHDGRTTFKGKPIFPSCTAARDAGSPACARCHGADPGKSRDDYAALELPRGWFGEVNWGQAEAEGKVRPLDALEGTSVPRGAPKIGRRGKWMTEVSFSHETHAIQNGCEACHPAIFPAARAGAVKFTMSRIADGAACGACHGKVAFPLAYCARCHPSQFP